MREIVRALAGPLRVEARKGYPDTAVIGAGIAEYARGWVERANPVVQTEAGREWCREIGETLADYGRCDAEGRKARVEAALRLLGQLEACGGQKKGGGHAETCPPYRLEGGGARPSAPLRAGSGAPLGKARPGGDRRRRKDGQETSSCPTHSPTELLDQPFAAGTRAHAGPAPLWVKRLAKLGIQTNRDLLYHFPRDYLALRRISELVDGERAAISVEVPRPSAGMAVEDLATMTREESVVREGRGFRLMRYALEVADASGQAWVTSFARVPRRGARAQAIANSPLTLSFAPGARLLIEGSVRRAGSLVEIQYAGSQRLAPDEDLEPGSLLPVYPLTDGVYQGQVRPVVRRLLDALPEDLADPLPRSLRERYHLLPLRQALRQMHWPSSEEARSEATRRLAFEELLTLQVALAQRKRERQQPGIGISMPPRGDLVALLEEILPFSLTRAQQRVISEVAADMASDLPMCRLIQGDVGSGKTVVAAAALMLALQNGYQGALMAPTELLAEQHYLVLSRLLHPVGVAVELLTGSLRSQDRERAYHRIASGRAQIIVGTHALIQEGVEFHRLGLVVVDEQHRFGVRQRAELRTKGGPAHLGGQARHTAGGQADTLVMTATPIPRTLALTLYGDLEISVLDEMPPGRQAIATSWLSLRQQREAYQFVRQQVAAGRQAYVVCPLIEESEKLQAEAATRLADELSREVFPDLRVGLLHGAMRVAEKDAVMEAFRSGGLDILTATTVVEVGVDVPNATMMLILNAERFGLAQLHQLRGRVGRGEHESYCLLLTDRKYDPSGRLAPARDDLLDTTRHRLRVLLDESDGFKIAEQDLLLRGPGEFYGTRQHGLPDFRLARMAREAGVLEEAREAAFWLIDQDPELAASEHAALRAQVAALRARMDRTAG